MAFRMRRRVGLELPSVQKFNKGLSFMTAITVKLLTPSFGAEIYGADLSRPLTPNEVERIQNLIDEYAVLVFRDQELNDEAQLDFSSYFGDLQKSISIIRSTETRRLRRPELSDISNVGEDGKRLDPTHVRRQLQLANLLWHTDNSFRTPSGRYTLLAAKTIPPEGGETEFADTRAAYDALESAVKERIKNFRAIHSLARSRELAGGPALSDEEKSELPSCEQQLVRKSAAPGRKALFIGSHADQIVGLDRTEGRALLDKLNQHATSKEFVYLLQWREGDLAMWDNRCTLHRGRPFDERRYLRDLRRTTIADSDMPEQSPVSDT